MKKKLKDLLEEHNACSECREWALQFKTPSEAWLKCQTPEWMLWALDAIGVKDNKNFRLFACWCARNTPLKDGRTTWDLLTDQRSRTAIEVSESFANEKATQEELATARAAALAAAWDTARAATARAAALDTVWAAALDTAWDTALDTAWDAARAAAWDTARDAAWDTALDATRDTAVWAAALDAAGDTALDAALDAARDAAWAAALDTAWDTALDATKDTAWAAALDAQCKQLRKMFGNPFKSGETAEEFQRMETAAEVTASPQLSLVKLKEFEAHIVKLKEQYADIDPKKDEDGARKARSELVKLRTTIDKERLNLTKGARDFQAEVNALGKGLITKVEEIETPIDVGIKAIEMERIRIRDEKQAEVRRKHEEQARIKAEAEHAEKQKAMAEERARMDKEAAEIKALADKLKAEREAFEAEQRAKQIALETEQRRLAEERRKEDEKFKAERRVIEAKLAEQSRIEAEEREEANRKLRNEEARLLEQKVLQEEEARLIALQKEKIEKEKQAEIDRKAKEEEYKAACERLKAKEVAEEAERQAALKARLDSLAPDRKLLANLAKRIRKATETNAAFATNEGTSAYARACSELERVAVWCDGWPLNNEIVDVRQAKKPERN